MKTGLSRSLRQIERKLPPIGSYQVFDYSFELGYVIYKGIRIHFEDFGKLFPNSHLVNVDFDVDLEIIKRHFLAEQAKKDLGIK